MKCKDLFMEAAIVHLKSFDWIYKSLQLFFWFEESKCEYCYRVSVIYVSKHWTISKASIDEVYYVSETCSVSMASEADIANA